MKYSDRNRRREKETERERERQKTDMRNGMGQNADRRWKKYCSFTVDMIWYDMIWYDMIWYDMIWYQKSEKHRSIKGENQRSRKANHTQRKQHNYCNLETWWNVLILSSGETPSFHPKKALGTRSDRLAKPVRSRSKWITFGVLPGHGKAIGRIWEMHERVNEWDLGFDNC